jgi:hypothetical protein
MGGGGKSWLMIRKCDRVQLGVARNRYYVGAGGSVLVMCRARTPVLHMAEILEESLWTSDAEASHGRTGV